MKRFALGIAAATLLVGVSITNVGAVDPFSLGMLIIKNRAALTETTQQAMRPGQVDSAKLTESFADLSRQILNCYHRTARYQFADPIAANWPRQNQYGATDSVVIRINYEGVTRQRYVMHVAVLAKQNAVRTVVINDNAVMRWSRDCELENWKSAS